jgi:diphthamide biosynthesis enzyme Dph1/Dph2-like protein
MHQLRRKAIEEASKAKKMGIILGTLGRQGNLKILEVIKIVYLMKLNELAFRIKDEGK